MSNRMKHLREMEEVETNVWTAIDKAQLDEYEKNGPKEITVGDIEYRISKYYMDDNEVPTLELVNKKTRSVHHVQLSLVWSGYQNYSMLDNNGREELRRKYFL